MDIGIIWSENISIQFLKTFLIDKNIESKKFSNFFNDESNVSLIKPNELFLNNGDVINPEFIERFSAIYILAELEWFNHSLSDFYGLTLARILRLNDFRIPVFICSFMPERILINDFKNKILTFRGHYFIQLPNIELNVMKIESLDDLEMDYCKSHLCDLKGAIREIFHKKQYALNSGDLETGKEIVKNILQELKSLTDLPGEIIQRINERLIEVDNIKNQTELNLFIKQDESVFLEYFTDEEKGNSEIAEQPIGKWEILILDDVPGDVHDLIQKLTQYFKNKIHLATSYNEAVSIIENDINNFITVVISDYRLETEINGTKYLKEKQGYSFVEWLSRQNHLNEIFVFSGLARSFLKTTFKQFNIRVNIISKYDASGEDKLREFAEEIFEKGNEIYDAIQNMPNCKGWDELSYYYSFYRGLNNYKSIEKEISYQAREVITQIKHLRETIELSGVRESDIERLPLFSQVKTFPNLTGRLSNMVKKSSYMNISEAIITRGKYDSGKFYIWKDPSEKKTDYVNKYFKNKLIARRIAWWLIFHEGIHLNTIYSLLMKGEYFNNYFSKEQNIAEWRSGTLNDIPETNDAKTLINTRLAVIKEDFPNNMLIEEKNWFKYEMGWDPAILIQKISGFENYFTGLFESFLPEMNKKRTQFQQLNERFIRDGGFVFHHANDIRKAFELVFDCIDDSNTVQIIIEESFKRFNYEDRICLNYFKKLKNFLLKKQEYFKNRK
jgi:hypothetical protein